MKTTKTSRVINRLGGLCLRSHDHQSPCALSTSTNLIGMSNGHRLIPYYSYCAKKYSFFLFSHSFCSKTLQKRHNRKWINVEFICAQVIAATAKVQNDMQIIVEVFLLLAFFFRFLFIFFCFISIRVEIPWQMKRALARLHITAPQASGDDALAFVVCKLHLKKKNLSFFLLFGAVCLCSVEIFIVTNTLWLWAATMSQHDEIVWRLASAGDDANAFAYTVAMCRPEWQKKKEMIITLLSRTCGRQPASQPAS